MIDACDHRLSALDRLAKRVEYMRREFRDFIKKEDAVMSERNFSRFGPRTAAYKRRHARGMMWRAKRPIRSERAVCYHACDALDHRNLEKLLRLKRRKNASEPLSKHRLARSRWPDHEHVVAARRRDLKRALGALLAAHVLEIRDRLCALIEMRLRLRNQCRSLEVIDEGHQMRRRDDRH